MTVSILLTFCCCEYRVHWGIKDLPHSFSPLILLTFYFTHVVNVVLLPQKNVYGGTVCSVFRDREPWRQWASMIRTLGKALERSPGWKHCWRLQDGSTLVVMSHRAWFPAQTGESSPGTADDNLQLWMENAPIKVMLSYPEAISLPVDAMLCHQAEGRGQQEPCEIQQWPSPACEKEEPLTAIEGTCFFQSSCWLETVWALVCWWSVIAFASLLFLFFLFFFPPFTY